MTLGNYAFSRQRRAQFFKDIYTCVLWRNVAVHIWRVKELFVPGIVASTIKVCLTCILKYKCFYMLHFFLCIVLKKEV